MDGYGCITDTETSFLVFFFFICLSFITFHTFSSLNPEMSQVETGDNMDVSVRSFLVFLFPVILTNIYRYPRKSIVIIIIINPFFR